MPARSLLAELETFRARIEPPRNHRERAESELLDRWIKHHSRNKEWKQIHDHAPTYPWSELIKAILHIRHSAWETDDRLGAWAEWRREIKEGFNYALSGSAHNQDPAAVIKLLQDALTEARLRFGDFKYVEVREVPAKINFSQKRGKFTRAQRLFIQMLVDYFSNSFGRPFYDAVATAAVITFPELEDLDLTAKEVASVFKATTKLGRSKRSH
jgi:hypothetical protein